MTSCTGSMRGGFGGIWKKLVELSLTVRRRRVTFASSQWPCGGCRTWWGGADGKVIIERLCISLPYVETLNSKVIKGFVPELRSRYVFFVFRDSYVQCIYITNILCTFHIFMYGYVTKTFQCILQEEQPSCLFLWWDFYSWVSIEKFSRSSEILFLISIISTCFIVSVSNIPNYKTKKSLHYTCRIHHQKKKTTLK